jgi:putative transposase
MVINKSFRYELKPNNKQEGLLRKSCGVARFAYNWGLARRIELYKTKEGKERFTNAITQHKELNALKKTDYPWMYDVSKCAPQMALINLDVAYKNMFTRIKKHEYEIGKPKYKKKGKHDSCSFSQTNNTIQIRNNSIRLPRIGWVRTKETTDKFRGRILDATVIREADRWYCSLAVEVNRLEPKLIQGDIIGMDLGLSCFATIYDGKEIQNVYSPKPLAKKLNKIKKYHHNLSRKQKGSKNSKKAQLRLSRAYKETKDVRKDFIAKETTRLAKTKSVIIIEDLNVKGMVKNHRLARSISDAGWGMFKQMLEYKTKWYGSRLIKIGRFEPSSKVCSKCGSKRDHLKLSDRIWICENCGATHDRDENAAINIRHLGIKQLNTESSSGINACGESVSPSLNKAVLVEARSKRIYNE